MITQERKARRLADALEAEAEAEETTTTWDPIDLGPYLRGEVERPKPSLGIARSRGTSPSTRAASTP